MAPPKTPAVMRFLAKIAPFAGSDPTQCWPWPHGRLTSGYGAFYNDAGRQVGAHRFSYEHFVGPIPEGLFVLHGCDNPPCVNPAHLHVGTQTENLAERTARGRADARRGAAHHHAKLTEDEVRAIRADPRTLAAIGADYGLDFGTVGKIKRRTRWAHVA